MLLRSVHILHSGDTMADGWVEFDDADHGMTTGGCGMGFDVSDELSLFDAGKITTIADCAVATRVDSLSVVEDSSKGGLMIRETVDPGSKLLALFMTKGHGLELQSRDILDALNTEDIAEAHFDGGNPVCLKWQW